MADMEIPFKESCNLSFCPLILGLISTKTQVFQYFTHTAGAPAHTQESHYVFVRSLYCSNEEKKQKHFTAPTSAAVPMSCRPMPIQLLDHLDQLDQLYQLLDEVRRSLPHRYDGSTAKTIITRTGMCLM
jgi:hypothetical protein